jgi:hypothetical protein
MYFVDRDSLVRYIDAGNPGDCHINTYWDLVDSYDNSTDGTDWQRYIAPNGRLYRIKYTQWSTTINVNSWSDSTTTSDSQYTSSDFSKSKYFDNLDDLHNFIDDNNKPRDVWNHVIDVDFTPFYHIAPNGKVYKIYHTDQGYMSYKFTKVRYFDFLADIKNHINKYNPKKK